MGHGLWVAFFVTTVLTAALALDKVGEKIRNFSPTKVSYYLLIILVLCKSKAALLYGFFAFIMVKKTSYKMQFHAAALIALMTLLYPTMSIVKVFPHQGFLNVASNYLGAERASSLKFRFDNELILLEHARKRFIFGWGGWGRNRVYDNETGVDLTVTDGRWIITLGTFGMIGFIAEFGLLALSIFRAKKAVKLIKDKKQQTLLAAHALVVSIIMLDQIPNASLAPWLWLVVGGLIGRSEEILLKQKTGAVN